LVAASEEKASRRLPMLIWMQISYVASADERLNEVVYILPDLGDRGIRDWVQN
jgi:uracil phosphoribosyltransferase